MSSDKEDNLWIIAGKNANKLFYINEKGLAEDQVAKHGLPKDVQFTDLRCLAHSRVLVGTKKHYAFLIQGKKSLWLNRNFGLTDSVTKSFDYDAKLKLILLHTEQTRFVLRNETKWRRVRFVEIKDTISTFDEIVNFFRHHVKKRFQKEVLDVIGDVDFSFRKFKYLDSTVLAELKQVIEPGDIILRRNEMVLTNIGIPGFWTHSGIYVGDTTIFNAYFKKVVMPDNELPSTFLKEHYPEIYTEISGKLYSVIEGIAKGVVIEPLEHIGNADYLVVLRPKLKKEDIFKSLLTAFEYLGTPYDFLFDFSNDMELVCSELLYHAFKPQHDKDGIRFDFGLLDGKPFISPNDIAKQYCIEQKKKQGQFEFIYFFDASQYKKKKIKKAGEGDFCKTWKKKML